MITKYHIYMVAAAVVIGTIIGCAVALPAHACKLAPRSPLCQPGQENCEPQCITTSDGGPGRDNMYTDGRRPNNGAFQRMERARYQARMRTIAAQNEGRNQWRNNGTPSSVGTISPFVPGSTQDTAWRAERRAHGIQ